MPVQTQETLNKMICDNPLCKEDHQALYLHPACHVNHHIIAFYDKKRGTINFSCSFCKKYVAEVAVKEADITPS
jgi:hypothetical protein